jgi:FG-GAP-like repeat/Stigma-specific protein, Stig1
MKPMYRALALALPLTAGAVGCSPDAPIGADASSSSQAGAGGAAGGAGGGAGGLGGSTVTGSGGAPACAANETMCDGTCVDLARDAAHCGACDRACPAGDSCSFGLCGVPCAGTLGFPGDPLPSTGRMPEDVALVDFDHDGNLDVVTLDEGAGGVRVRLGLGDGRFGPSIDTTAWSNPVASGVLERFALGDVDGDGEIDAVLTHNADDEIVVLLGHGDGTFAAPIVTANVPAPSAIVLGDLDADGHLDAVVIASTGRFGVMLGAGDGTFAAPVLQPTGTKPNPANNGPRGLALSDFDGDGALDLFISNDSGELSTFRGRGDGSFKPPIVSDLGGAGYGLAVDDMDGDGILDAVVIVETMWKKTDVFRGQGDGTFTSWDSHDYSAAGTPVIADVDGDGILDVVALEEGWEDFGVLRGLGGGMLAFVDGYAARGVPTAVAVGDLDGDGDPDVVASVPAIDALGVSLNDGDGTFPDSLYPPGGQTGADVISADVNGDGNLDLCVALKFGPAPFEPRFDVYLGDGHGSFGAPVGDNPFLPDGESVDQMAFVDVNGDGHLDLVSVGATVDATHYAHGIVRVRLGAGDGTFGAPITTALTYYYQLKMALADVDSDGFIDVLVLADHHIELHRGAGDGTFGPETQVTTLGEHPWDIVAGDWDGDGAVDLAVTAIGSGPLVNLHGEGDGTFSVKQTIDIPSYADVAVGDMNADGIIDLVLFVSSSVNGSSVRVLLGQGDGTFGAAIDTPAGGGEDGIRAADLDGDGNLDVVLSSGTANSIFVMRGVGDGTLLPPIAYASPAYTWAFTIGDMDNDGSRDVVAVGNTGEPVLLTNRCLP